MASAARLVGRQETPKDDYFDTMDIKVIVLIFCPKPLKIAGFLTLLRKALFLTWQQAGLEAALFCFLGVIRGWLSLFDWGNRCNIENIPDHAERPGTFFNPQWQSNFSAPLVQLGLSWG
jgi:hypothetical protein